MIRPDLSETITNARAVYIDPLSGTPSVNVDPSIQTIINQYKTLTKKVNPNGKLANAIKNLLVDPNRPLLLSYELSTLDLDQDNCCKQGHF